MPNKRLNRPSNMLAWAITQTCPLTLLAIILLNRAFLADIVRRVCVFGPFWKICDNFMGGPELSALLPTYNRADVAFERGEGAWLVTASGDRYLDFTSGVAVASLGHAHPKLVAAASDQISKVWHTSNLFQVPLQEKLAQRLCDLSGFADRVFFGNSGAEAIECGIKIVRKYHASKGQPNKFRIITFEGAFHGRTLATLAAGGQQKYLDGFGPKVDGFDQVPFGDLAAVKAAITDETAGILIEPIQGEGGLQPAPLGFLRDLRAICDEHGLLLFFDEIQCGMGRTGKIFAHHWDGVKPDVMALAKALGGGFPIGACLATETAASGMVAGSHGSTFGGNPLGCAVANAVVDVMSEPGFLEQVCQRAGLFRQKLEALQASHPDVIEEIRGMGLMVGLKCKKTNTDLVVAARKNGLLTVAAGDNVVRLLPPLIVSDQELDEAVKRLDRACAELVA